MILSLSQHKSYLASCFNILKSKQEDLRALEKDIDVLTNEIRIKTYQICLAESKKLLEFDGDDRSNLWDVQE